MKNLITLLLLLVTGLVAAPSNGGTEKPIRISEVSDNITLDGSVTGTVQFTLYDMKGRRLYRTRQVITAGISTFSLPKDIQKNQVVIMEISDGRWKLSEQLVLR